jgi:DNA polymerase elongation subunit (family B)
MSEQLNLSFDAPPAESPQTPPSGGPAEAILFGHDATSRIVAVEPGESHVTLWLRDANGQVRTQTEPLRLWIATPEPTLDAFATPTVLAGEGYRYLYEFSDRATFWDARERVRESHLDHLTYPNATRLHLLRTGKTLFKGMAMRDVSRMQIDIETEGLSPEQNRVLLVAVGDNRGFFEAIGGSEPEILARLAEVVRERDPDVIEGHNILGFDLPFLMKRAALCRVSLGLGRDGSEPRTGPERNFAIGGNTRPFSPVFIHGRHVIDTYLAVQRFDWAKGALSSYGLKEVARAFGISEPERIILDRARLAEIYREDPERVAEYARHDVVETGRLAEMVAATEFYQTQMVPDSYQNVAVSGSGDKINCLLIRAYLHAGHAVPRPQRPRAVPGGHTELRATGVIDRVVKADVESLYPSIMLTDRIHPNTDTLGVFLPALEELTRRRIEAKGRVRAAEGAERHYWDGLQNSFKVLINSFYGYLGAAGLAFNDPDAAARVTERGRALVKAISAELEATGSRIIEIDTDGVYFVPPETVQGEEAERAYVEQIGLKLPQGIRLAFDGRFRAMVSVKTKNYVLLDYEGKRTFKGASLRSRADEGFGREFLARAVDLLLERRYEDLGVLYRDCIRDILEHRVPIQQLARRERVTDKTFTSLGKVRSAAAAANTAVGEFIQVYERADGTLARAEDYTPESENTAYYMDKLHKFACRLREAIEPAGVDFERLFPRPGPNGIVDDTQLSLF